MKRPLVQTPTSAIFSFLLSAIFLFMFCLIAVFFLCHTYVFHNPENFPTVKLYGLIKQIINTRSRNCRGRPPPTSPRSSRFVGIIVLAGIRWRNAFFQHVDENIILCWGFTAQSTTQVMLSRSVNLSTLFLCRLPKRLTFTKSTPFL